jgi:hypothetical protein
MALDVHSRSLVRARWYGELTSALLEAEQLLKLLEARGSFPDETRRLCIHVAAIRSELEMLNRVAISENRIVGIPWSELRPTPGGTR